MHPDAIYVLDRGGDRSTLLDRFIHDEQQFVIRCQDQRSLRLHADSRKTTNIATIARSTKTSHSYKSLRNGKWYQVGIRRVYYGETALWLVVSRNKNGGMSWYLTNGAGTRRAIMNRVMEAYGLRWRVEEYHRQVKQDYGLESISLRKYSAIKNMGVLVMLAASFCASLPKHLAIRMIAAVGRLPRRRLSDIPDYPHYMIVAAVARVLETTTRRRPKPLRVRKRDYFQLELHLTGI
jgi:hypothetical protein